MDSHKIKIVIFDNDERDRDDMLNQLNQVGRFEIKAFKLDGSSQVIIQEKPHVVIIGATEVADVEKFGATLQIEAVNIYGTIVLSAKGSTEMAMAAKKIGAVTCISKPISTIALVEDPHDGIELVC